MFSALLMTARCMLCWGGQGESHLLVYADTRECMPDVWFVSTTPTCWQPMLQTSADTRASLLVLLHGNHNSHLPLCDHEERCARLCLVSNRSPPPINRKNIATDRCFLRHPPLAPPPLPRVPYIGTLLYTFATAPDHQH